ncbi:MAG: hypothetical protein V4557_03220 [Bacteroidota bacterium]
MKINLGIVALVTGVFFFMDQTKAQTGITNIRETQSQTGYTVGNYYYYPEIDTWYDIYSRRFVYFENGRWVYSDAVSGKNRYYDIANAYKVQVTEKKPYMHAAAYRELYADYYTAYQNRFVNRGVLVSEHMDNNDRIYNRPVQRSRPIQEQRRIEESPLPENKAANEISNPVSAQPSKAEPSYEPEHFEEHKPVVRGKIQPAEKTDLLRVDNKTDIRAKEETRARIEPVKKEPVGPVKVQEPVKTDSIPTIIRLPGGIREAQYSDKFKKKVEGQ